MDVVFNWRTLDSSENTQQPLVLQNSTVRCIGTNVSILMFRPIIISKVVVVYVEAVCAISSYPANELINGNKSAKLLTFKSEVLNNI